MRSNPIKGEMPCQWATNLIDSSVGGSLSLISRTGVALAVCRVAATECLLTGFIRDWPANGVNPGGSEINLVINGVSTENRYDLQIRTKIRNIQGYKPSCFR